jgi:non-homologous end joining protein Ku
MNKNIEIKIGMVNLGIASGYGIQAINKETKESLHGTIIQENTGYRLAQQASVIAFEYVCKYVLEVNPEEIKQILFKDLEEKLESQTD